MTARANNEACERFLDDLAAVVDGDPDVLALHLDHLEECDGCRDVRHEAMGVLAAIGGAGDDLWSRAIWRAACSRPLMSPQARRPKARWLRGRTQ